MRTRFAYNPSKPFDLVELRDCLYSYLIAKHEGGTFVVSIEDANQENYDLKNEENFHALLPIFSINYDEGPKKGSATSYVQSERLELYKSYAEKLVKKNNAYYCFCTKEELNRKRLEATEKKETYQYDKTHRNFPKDEALRKIGLGEKYVIRAAMPEDEIPTTFNDLVYGDVSIPNTSLEDYILIKSNGTPTYTFASALDDALMQIDIVLRPIHTLSSTPKYIHLYTSLGFPIPKFLHLPNILGLSEKKDTLNDLLHQGFLPNAILNYVALLGWNPKTKQELFSMEELIRVFDYKNIVKRPAHFDMQKLKWFNRAYIKKMDEETYINYVRPYLERCYDLTEYSEEWIRTLLLAYKTKLSFASEIGFLTHQIFTDLIELNEEAVTYLKGEKSIPNTLLKFKETIQNCTTWTKESLKETLENLKEQCQVEDAFFYMPIRVSLTGVKEGIPFYDLIYLLGKEKILNRMEEII